MSQEWIWDVNIPYNEEINFNTLLTKYEDGKEQRRKKWSAPKRAFSITLKSRTSAIIQQLWDFYIARDGAYESFHFVNLNENPVTNEYVGSGDSVTTVFNLAHSPLPSGSITVSASGVSKEETTDYTLNRTTGVITFNTAPTGDNILSTYSFAYTVRFAEDRLTRELFNYKLENASLKLMQTL